MSRSRVRRQLVISVIVLCLSLARSATDNEGTEGGVGDGGTGNVTGNGTDALNYTACHPPAVEEFPEDLFTADQRESGAIFVHVAAAVYLIIALGVICDDFFVPVLEIICDTMDLKPDVAGATFMAAGTSSPEFFSNIMGTFVTKSDLGIGTIVGSAVFNIFGVIAVCGLFSGRKIKMDWYPITRDAFTYGITVVILIIVLIDERVFWYESMVMVLCYLLYIVLMVVNPKVERWAHRTKNRVRSKIFPDKTQEEEDGSFQRRKSSGAQHPANESTPLHVPRQNGKAVVAVDANGDTESPANSSVAITLQTPASRDSVDKAIQVPTASTESVRDEADGDDADSAVEFPWTRPQGKGVFAHLWWILFFPFNLIFFLTIPDVRFGGKCAKLYPLSFVLCIAWIGAISYVLTWMITVIGFTIGVPDSVMGLTFLAVGTSVPEVVSSLIVARQGKGSMAVSNSIGSNTFDILLCLGLPWLVKSLMTGYDGGDWLVPVQSEGLAYTTISLLLSLILLYAILAASKFILSRTLGVTCLVIYAVFLTIAILFELNVFYVVTLPTCASDY